MQTLTFKDFPHKGWLTLAEGGTASKQPVVKVTEMTSTEENAMVAIIDQQQKCHF